MPKVYMVQIYVSDEIVKTVAFSNEFQADIFARAISNDDGLQGIDKVEVVEVPMDNDAIDLFWAEVNALL